MLDATLVSHARSQSRNHALLRRAAAPKSSSLGGGRRVYLCGRVDTTAWATENGFDARRCAGCRLVYVTPRPRLDLIDAATRTGSHLTDHGELSVTGTFSAIRQRRLRMVVKRMFREHVRNGVPLRWLDIGCGHGELLLTLRGVLPAGSTIVGVEPNVHKIAGARARGAQVVAGLEDVDGEFDVLSLMNVYSHLPDPVLTISEITSRFLADNGELLVETGNAAEVPDRSHYPGCPRPARSPEFHGCRPAAAAVSARRLRDTPGAQRPHGRASRDHLQGRGGCPARRFESVFPTGRRSEIFSWWPLARLLSLMRSMRISAQLWTNREQWSTIPIQRPRRAP